MTPDYEHWFEMIAAALVGLGGWLWRLGRKEQAQEDRLSRLEQWRTAFSDEMRGDIVRVERETEDHFTRMESRLHRIEEKQHEQDIVLARIETNQESTRETLLEIKQSVGIIMGERREDGNRWYDPQRREQ